LNILISCHLKYYRVLIESYFQDNFSVKRSALLVILLFTAISSESFAQAGILDSTFAKNGIDTCSSCGFISIKFNSNGKILGGASFDPPNDRFAVTQSKQNGTLDSSFGINGVTEVPQGINSYYYPYSISVQSDGKIIEAGNCWDGIKQKWSFVLARFDTTGIVDSSFNNDGEVLTSFNTLGASDYGYDATIQSDGKIVQVGMGIDNSHTHYFAIVRYNQNGTIDNSFGTSGKVLTTIGNAAPYARSVIVQPDSKILVGGYSASAASFPVCFALARYNSNGFLDNAFGTGGKVTTYFGAGGSSGNNLDDDEAYCIALQPDGKIILAGYSYLGSDTFTTFALARYNTNGSLDNTFGIGGKVRMQVPGYKGSLLRAITLQEDNKIIAVGSCCNMEQCYDQNFVVARYNTNGLLDSTFGTNGIVISQLDDASNAANSVITQSDGKILVGGGSMNYGILARYLSGLNVGIVDLNSAGNSVFIYPNPIEQNATLKYTLQNQEAISIRLFDVQGKIIKTFIENENQRVGEHQQEIVLPDNLSSGSYLIVISAANGGRVTIKVVK